MSCPVSWTRRPSPARTRHEPACEQTLICFTYEQNTGRVPMPEGPRPTPPALTDAGLDGAVIIVTGGGSGIGAATARQLGAVGAPVVLVGRRAEPLNEIAAQITAGGGQALCVPADLAAPASPRRITDACLARYG